MSSASASILSSTSVWNFSPQCISCTNSATPSANSVRKVSALSIFRNERISASVVGWSCTAVQKKAVSSSQSSRLRVEMPL